MTSLDCIQKCIDGSKHYCEKREGENLHNNYTQIKINNQII
jgi:hypothetical protein